MTPSPIGKVLSTFRKYRVRALLMGGQACILYGAAEFSRDVGLAVAADEKNLTRLRHALAELRAEPVFVPALSPEVLLQGHACHFRLKDPEARGIRIDVMSVMHGCDPFEELWKRRRQLKLPGIGSVNVLSLRDLVQAKKTQRDKDWPMVRRLVEADFAHRATRPTRNQILFWLSETRNPEFLMELCRHYPRWAGRVAKDRPAVRHGLKGEFHRVDKALRDEEEAFRSADQAYWQPLRTQLLVWRRALKQGEA